MRKKTLILVSIIALIIFITPVIFAVDYFAIRIEYDDDNNAIYVGRAMPGTATTAAAWQIQYLTYDDDNNCTAVEWAEGSWAFSYTWTLRATYDYE